MSESYAISAFATLCRNRSTRLKSLLMSVGHVFRETIFDTSVSAVREEAHNKYSSIFRLFHPAYHRLMRRLKSVAVNPDRLTYREALRALDDAVAAQEIQRWFDSER